MNILKFLLPLLQSSPTLAPLALKTVAGAIRADPALVGQLVGHLPASPLLTTLTPILSANPTLVADVLDAVGAQGPAFLTELLGVFHVG